MRFFVVSNSIHGLVDHTLFGICLFFVCSFVCSLFIFVFSQIKLNTFYHRLSPQSAMVNLTGTPQDLNMYRNEIDPSVATRRAHNSVG